MAIADFATLRAQVQSYCARSDTKFTNMVETFVAFAEDRIFNGAGKKGETLYSAPLRVSEMEKIASLTVPSSGESGLPSNCLDVRAVTFGTQQLPLYLKSPSELIEWSNAGGTGEAQFYTVEADVLKIAPAQEGVARVLYFERPPALTVSDPTHDVLVAFPLIYLSLTLHEAFSWMQEQDASFAHLVRGKAQIDGANRVAMNKRILAGAPAQSFEPIG